MGSPGIKSGNLEKMHHCQLAYPPVSSDKILYFCYCPPALTSIAIIFAFAVNSFTILPAKFYWCRFVSCFARPSSFPFIEILLLSFRAYFGYRPLRFLPRYSLDSHLRILIFSPVILSFPCSALPFNLTFFLPFPYPHSKYGNREPRFIDLVTFI